MLLKLPHGNEKISVLDLGLGGIHKSSSDEIESIIRSAIKHGINYFDLCASEKKVYAPFGRAIKDNRKNVYFQLHFGAVYNEKGEYGWSRKLDEVKETFEWQLKTLETDYIDMGFLHCVDEEKDYNDLISSGIFDFLKSLKEQGVVHHIGFSSHTPSVANKILDTGIIDMMMFSINPAYDFEQGDDYGVGSVSERAELFRRCEKDGVGISVMKPFYAGKLLDEKESPFHQAITKNQCIQYALDRPGVMVVLPGIRNTDDFNEVVKYIDATDEEKDYLVLGTLSPEQVYGNCVYCNHCAPCPQGINIGLVNKYYDLAMAGDDIAKNHYDKLEVKADACIGCGHCDNRCPFRVKQSEKMQKINTYFQK